MASNERTALLRKDASALPNNPADLALARRILITGSVVVGVFLGALDLTLVATLITPISSEFKQSNQSGWLGTSYLLATATATPLYGRLCDIMGRRSANMTAALFFGTGTLLCGLAPDMRTLLAARLIAGMGGGGLMTTASIVASDLFSVQNRGAVQGVVNVLFGLGAGLGGPVGGLIADSIGWRWAFLAQVPVILVCSAMVFLFVRYTLPGQAQSTREKLKRVDYFGSLTLVIWVGSLLLAMSFKTNELEAWGSIYVWLPLLTAAVFVAAFVLVEARISVEPIMPMSLIRQRTPLFTNMVNFCCAFVGFSILYFFPTFFQIVELASAGTAGSHLIPHAVALAVGSLSGGLIMRRTGKYYWLIVISAGLPLITVLSLSYMTEDWPSLIQWLVILPSSFGYGCTITALLVALIASLERKQVAVATGVSYLFRYVGQVVGVGLSASIMQNVLTNELRRRFDGPDAAQLIDDIRHEAALIRHLPPEQRSIAIDAFRTALHAVFRLNTLVGLAGLICAVFIVEFPLASKLDPDDGDELNGER